MDTSQNVTAAAPTDGQSKEKLKGIKGWLILPAFGLSVGLVLSVIQEWYWLDLLLSHDALLSGAIVAAVESLFVMNTAFAAVVAYSFFHEKAITVKMMIALLLTSIVTAALSELVISGGLGAQPDLLGVTLKPTITAAIWIPYFMVSKRVKATFIR